MPDFGSRRLGAIHAAVPAWVPDLRATAVLRDGLPPLKPETDWLGGIDWQAPADPELGNGTIGDCVPVSALQMIRCRTEKVWGAKAWVPTAAQATALYEAVGGYDPSNPATDVGTVPPTFMGSWCSAGIDLGQGTIDVPLWRTVTLEHTANAIDLCGPVRITLNLCTAMQDPSNWSAAPGTGPDWQPGSWGQHSVVGGRQKAGVLGILTWAEDLDIHPELLAATWLATDAVISRSITITDLQAAAIEYAAQARSLAAVA